MWCCANIRVLPKACFSMFYDSELPFIGPDLPGSGWIQQSLAPAPLLPRLIMYGKLGYCTKQYRLHMTRQTRWHPVHTVVSNLRQEGALTNKPER